MDFILALETDCSPGAGAKVSCLCKSLGFSACMAARSDFLKAAANLNGCGTDQLMSRKWKKSVP